MLTQVGKYLIEEKVGVGGFGTVYKGRDPFIKRAVAIKTCQSDEEEIKKRFFREAEFAGNLHHRNITTIYDFGVTDDGTPYIVQEFLTGEDLDKLVKKREPMTLKRKLAILVDVCEGLGYAHAAGIIHRDIKPSNVRILEDGTVKLMDFGIAKSMVSQSTLTQTGITLGTASYLAPEQIRGEALDPRTDIFSLGVMAYELVTSQKPFTGDHISTVLYKIMNEQPGAPSTIVAGLPRGLDGIVLRALEKDRTRRYTSCAEVKADLGAVLASLGDTDASAPARVGDMDKTVATPSAGYKTGTSPRTPSRVLDTPIGPAAAARATQGGAADVHLRATGVLPAASAPTSDRGPALRVFLAAAFVLLAGGGAFYLYQQKSAMRPQPVPAPPAPATAASASTAAHAATDSPPPAEPSATASSAAPAPGTSFPASVAPPPATTAAEPSPVAAPTPAPPVKETGPVAVSFRSNQVGILWVDGKKHGPVAPAGTRVTLSRGTHTAVFEVPGYMKITKEFDVEGAGGRPVSAEFPPRGIIVLTVLPAGADIRIDGVSIGSSTGAPLRKTLRSGSHEIVASSPGYVSQMRTVELDEEDSQAVRIELKKE
jgi:serine/threonine-protein kinase